MRHFVTGVILSAEDSLALNAFEAWLNQNIAEVPRATLVSAIVSDWLRLKRARLRLPHVLLKECPSLAGTARQFIHDHLKQ